MDEYTARRLARIEQKIELIFVICAVGISVWAADHFAPDLAASWGLSKKTAFGIIMLTETLIFWGISRGAFGSD